MIDLNTDHRKFSMAMEVLCSLPVYPAAVPPSDICDDLGLRPERLQRIVSELRKHNVYRNRGELCIAQKARGRATEAAQIYWETVNQA